MKAPKSELISRAGAYYSGYALSMSGIIFRETSSTDVGIDGQIELVDKDGSATGMLAGIQIKSGDSFVDHEQQKFTFKSSKEHYKYWSNLTIPTLGIVFSPKLQTASWFILEAHAEEILKNSGACSITQKLNKYNKLDFETSSGKHISDYIRKYYNRSITEEELDNFDSLKSDANSKSTTDKSDFEVSEENIIAWKRLITAFFSSNSKPNVIYDVGYRLSWYFPTVNKKQEELFKSRLSKMTTKELYNIFKGIKFAYKHNCERGFELITDLLRYKKNIITMLSTLKKSQYPTKSEAILIQEIIEYFEQDA